MSTSLLNSFFEEEERKQTSSSSDSEDPTTTQKYETVAAKISDVVKIIGLQKAKQYNECVAIICTNKAANGRIGIFIPQFNKQLAIKSVNFKTATVYDKLDCLFWQLAIDEKCAIFNNAKFQMCIDHGFEIPILSQLLDVKGYNQYIKQQPNAIAGCHCILMTFLYLAYISKPELSQQLNHNLDNFTTTKNVKSKNAKTAIQQATQLTLKPQLSETHVKHQFESFMDTCDNSTKKDDLFMLFLGFDLIGFKIVGLNQNVSRLLPNKHSMCVVCYKNKFRILQSFQFLFGLKDELKANKNWMTRKEMSIMLQNVVNIIYSNDKSSVLLGAKSLFRSNIIVDPKVSFTQRRKMFVCGILVVDKIPTKKFLKRGAKLIKEMNFLLK